MDVLIVDNNRNFLQTASAIVEMAGHTPHTAHSVVQADKVFDEENINVVILDQAMGHDDSLPYLRELLSNSPSLPVIISTDNSSVESAVTFIQNGAYTYLEKPFHEEHVKSVLSRIQSEIRDRRKLADLQQELSSSNPALILESLDEATQYAYDTAFKAAGSDANILLLGPSGNGKSVLAREIHHRSNRADEAFITVNCPSLSEELLESELFGHVKGAFTGAMRDSWGKVHAAAGGTLFFDEIGELPKKIQPKLLRLLQEQEYERIGETRIRKSNIRVISATNRDIEKEVQNGNFREDLLYRLNVISITIPSLKERKGDLERLAENFLLYYKTKQGRPNLGFSDGAMQTILEYEWPGNLRELSNVIERATILAGSDIIQHDDLSIAASSGKESGVWIGGDFSLEQLEEVHIQKVLDRSESIEAAADVLGIDTATLYRKRKKMGLL